MEETPPDEKRQTPALKRRRGLPAPSTITAISTVTTSAGRTVTFLDTTQTDAADKPRQKPRREKPK
jgi:hypothetical protein